MKIARSVLSVPASNWRMIEKAISSDADGVFLDLEDAVAPDQKVSARENVVRAVTELDWGHKSPAYRCNGLDTPLFYRDIIDVVERAGQSLDTIIIPKVGRPEDLVVADTLLSQIEASLNLESGRIKLEAQIETAGGLVRVDDISRASTRLLALVFGPGDYAASVNMPSESVGGIGRWDEEYPGHRFHYPMHRILVAARSAGLRAIDGPVADYRDLALYRRSCIIGRSLGYDGKWCIHPNQIAVANEVFSPTDDELAWAQKVASAYEKSLAEGHGAISIDGTMIDVASIRLAERTLEAARRARPA